MQQIINILLVAVPLITRESYKGNENEKNSNREGQSEIKGKKKKRRRQWKNEGNIRGDREKVVKLNVMEEVYSIEERQIKENW